MRDFTANFYCDLFWIADLIQLKKTARNKYEAKILNGDTPCTVSFTNVTIFGTIIDIRQIDEKKYLYYVDDGTGVIACKHNEDQFDQVIKILEREYENVFNETVQFNQSSIDQSSMTNESIEDSIFNDNSIQSEELKIMKANLSEGIQSLWSDIYDSFTYLLSQYKVGDVVLIDGKLYTYFNVNQIYINNIRIMNWDEEIMKRQIKQKEGSRIFWKTHFQRELEPKKRCSGLMTFDNVDHISVRIPPTRPMGPQRDSFPLPKDTLPVPGPPPIESTITFDTFNGMKMQLLRNSTRQDFMFK